MASPQVPGSAPKAGQENLMRRFAECCRFFWNKASALENTMRAMESVWGLVAQPSSELEKRRENVLPCPKLICEYFSRQ
ncbi:helix-turn-helix domain-containing protein [uncultured Desulfovibrio sp.]|uniref:helix-turn-helix domain-containing protein n=1 Tax=uncultured Desulfovibrio sp. TaxID=167968 RepID=UPI00345BEF10